MNFASIGLGWRASERCDGAVHRVWPLELCALILSVFFTFTGVDVYAQGWSISVTWTAPGDDGSVGTATEYDIRYSTSPVNDANWYQAFQAVGEPPPRSSNQADSFLITGLQALTTYFIAMKTRDEAYNWSALSNVISKTTRLTTDVGDDEQVPVTWELKQNFPNPFNPGTTIECNLATASRLRIAVYNLLGQHVIDLVDGPVQAGFHAYFWNGQNAQGLPVASGVYLYHLSTEGFTDSRRMTLLR